MPDWAAPQIGKHALRPRTSKQLPQPLEKREQHHAALVAAGNPNAASKVRLKARHYCAETGQPVPAWAASLVTPKARPKATPAPVAAPSAPLAQLVTLKPGEPLELPRALREWRAASGDRVVSIAANGVVTLYRSTLGDGKQKASFPSLAAACELDGEWRPVASLSPQQAFLGYPRTRRTAAE